MAVVTLYMSDRDKNKTFTDKKEADNYDKMLELAETVSVWMEKEISGISEEQAEAIGLLLAENKDTLMKAIKGKPSVLLANAEDAEEENVTSISATA